MIIKTIRTTPFSDQDPGTSGLRKKVRVFQQKGYLENFLQSLFEALPEQEHQTLVIGGDGRYFNSRAIQVIIRMAVANRYRRLLVGRDGLLSTPAVSNLIRTTGASGGIILSASHNAAGPEQDFGIKYNNACGRPAPASITCRLFEISRGLSEYRIIDTPDLDLSRVGSFKLGDAEIRIVDPVADYLQRMKRCFDFDSLRRGFDEGRLSIRFDAMHAITGPYARAIFEDELGAAPDCVVNEIPLEDFGGGHPDPNLVYAQDLYRYMHTAAAPVLAAASDGDGDRNMILGPGCFVSPGDSLAILAEHHRCIPQFRHGLRGVARSMPTSRAIDRVAQGLGISCYETPTGWKYFGNLLDAGKISLCGEESFGTGGDHLREKDGVWSVLFWLSVLDATRCSVAELLRAHWNRFGRSVFSRHDYAGLDAETAADLMHTLEIAANGSRLVSGYSGVERTDVFEYHDPVDSSRATNLGVRVNLHDGSRIVYRLSGTGTDSSTLRIYLERYVTDPHCFDPAMDAARFTSELAALAVRIAGVRAGTGLNAPTLVT